MKKIGIILLVLSILCVGLLLKTRYQHKTIVDWATELYPLGNQQTYIIRKNTELLSEEGEVIVPAGTFYVLTIPNEKGGDTNQFSSGRKIGSTSVDIEPYLDKEVHIKGYFFRDEPLFLIPEYTLNSSIRSKDQAVLHIFDIIPRE